MAKEPEYNLALICDSCGHKGAFNLHGDYVCHDCLDLEQDDEDEVGEFDED
jgi:hypothetical protein